MRKTCVAKEAREEEDKRENREVTNNVRLLARTLEPVDRWFNETLIKGGRSRARVETFALAINATVYSALTATWRGSAMRICLPREMERVPAGDYTCVT